MEPPSLKTVMGDMSAWPRPSTADVGLRVYAPTFEQLLTEAAVGMLDLIASPHGAQTAQQLQRHTSTWSIESLSDHGDRDMLLVTWLDEVLYRLEIHQEWLVDALIMVRETEDARPTIEVQVSWVDSDRIERELEIKAVTTHELNVSVVGNGETMHSPWANVPSMTGPGWSADVLFDI